MQRRKHKQLAVGNWLRRTAEDKLPASLHSRFPVSGTTMTVSHGHDHDPIGRRTINNLKWELVQQEPATILHIDAPTIRSAANLLYRSSEFRFKISRSPRTALPIPAQRG